VPRRRSTINFAEFAPIAGELEDFARLDSDRCNLFEAILEFNPYLARCDFPLLACAICRRRIHFYQLQVELYLHLVCDKVVRFTVAVVTRFPSDLLWIRNH
jgi:hypothetical protein